jgi:hypothetical protein
MASVDEQEFSGAGAVFGMKLEQRGLKARYAGRKAGDP